MSENSVQYDEVVNTPATRSPAGMVCALLGESFTTRRPLCVVVEELSHLSLVELRECAGAWERDAGHIIVPFSHRGATLEKILGDIAERTRLVKKYSIANAASQPAHDAIRDLCAPRDARLIIVIQHADRLPIDTFRHLAGALRSLDEDDEIGAHFFFSVAEGFFDSRRGSLLINSLGGERIVSNETFYESEQVAHGTVERAVPHPTDTLYVSPEAEDVTDVLPEMLETEDVTVYGESKGRHSPVLKTDPQIDANDDYAEISPRRPKSDLKLESAPDIVRPSFWKSVFGSRST